MRIGYIGAGKVACTLGKFFAEGGIEVTGYYSRHLQSAEDAAVFTGTKCYTSIGELLEDSDAVFLTVPDGIITEVYEQLKFYPLDKKRICHCSGAMSSREAFPGIEETGAYAYSIHPLFPISSRFDTYQELSDAFFCIEGDSEGLDEWKEMLEGLGLHVQLIKSDAKIKYHAACAIASNLVCALIGQSLELLAECGFDDALARAALAPLVRSNIEHILKDGPVDALTGPLERADAETISRHLEVITDEKDRDLYKAASRKLIELASKKHPDRDYSTIIYYIGEEN